MDQHYAYSTLYSTVRKPILAARSAWATNEHLGCVLADRGRVLYEYKEEIIACNQAHIGEAATVGWSLSATVSKFSQCGTYWA